MNNNHNIKDLDLLYADAKKLFNEIVSERIDGYYLKGIDNIINDIEEYWHGQDSIIQINNLLEIKNKLIDNRDIIGNIAVYISMMAKNYREAQNTNGTNLPSIQQLEYKRINKSEKININSSEIYMNANLSSVINSLNSFIENLNEMNNVVTVIKNSIMDNWVQEDANRSYAIKMFEKFSSDVITIVKDINQVIKCINTSIEKYNSSLKEINSMPSLESMFNMDNSFDNEYTPEEQRVLDSIKKNFENNKKLNDGFNKVLVNEVTKELKNRGVL